MSVQEEKAQEQWVVSLLEKTESVLSIFLACRSSSIGQGNYFLHHITAHNFSVKRRKCP